MAKIFIDNLYIDQLNRQLILEALGKAKDITIDEFDDETGLGTVISLLEDETVNMPFVKMWLNMPNPDAVSKNFAKNMARLGFVGGCLATVAGTVILAKSVKALKAKHEKEGE